MKKFSISPSISIQNPLAHLPVSNLTEIFDWLVGALYSLSTIILFLAAVNAWTWSQKPFPGFMVEHTLIVSGLHSKDWSGYNAGLTYPQRITHIDGQMVNNLDAFKAILKQFQTGDRLEIRSLGPNGDSFVYPDVQLSDFSQGDFLRLFILPFGIGVAFWLLGLWVYNQRRQTDLGIAFGYFCLSAAISSVLIFDLSSTHSWVNLWFVAIAQLGGAMIVLGIFFLDQWQTRLFNERLSLIPIFGSVALSIWGVILMKTSGDPWQYISVWRLGYYYGAVGFVIFFILMFIQARKASSALVKQQARIVLWGSFVAFLPVSLWMGVPITGHFIDWNSAILLPPMMIFPVSIGVAVLRYHLWDFDVIVNRALVYGLLSAALAAVYFGSIMLLQQTLYGWSQGASPIVITASTILTTLLVSPIRTRTQSLIDRLFFRQKYDATLTLSAFAHKLREFIDLDVLERELREVIIETMQPTSVVLCSCTPLGSEETDIGSEFTDGPLHNYLLASPNAVDLDDTEFDNLNLNEMRHAGVKLLVPLASQGELVGVLKVGNRRGGQGYTTEDLNLLGMLAGQAAPALRVAQLVREQREEALEHQRLQSELRLAGLVQQTLLPKQVPTLPGWELSVHYQPASEVSGDIYDFFVLPDGRLVLNIGDVTDKGIPAALIMTSIRSILRGAIRRTLPPGVALQRSNDLLVPEMLPNMFVTCHYAILEPGSGHYIFANAGHSLPFCKRTGETEELRARGFPLGIMPGTNYEEHETVIEPGECILLFSDGLIEAHNPQGEIYGTHRLKAFLENHTLDNGSFIPDLLADLYAFTGPDWEQEDDLTILCLHRCVTHRIERQINLNNQERISQ